MEDGDWRENSRDERRGGVWWIEDWLNPTLPTSYWENEKNKVCKIPMGLGLGKQVKDIFFHGG